MVLYQLLVGDLTRPLTTDWAEHISDPLLRDDLKHCFAGNPQDRFAGAGQLAKNLRDLPHRQRALAEQQTALAVRERAAYRRGIIRTAALSALLLAIFGLLSIYAFRQAARAQKLAREEARQRELLKLSLYAANMNLALQAVNEGNLGRASTLLAQYRPLPGERDLRGFEWRYLWKQAQSDETATLGSYDGPYAWQALAFSPNGMYLASRDGPNIAIRLFSTRTVIQVLTNAGGEPLKFSPDGKYLFAPAKDCLRRWNVSTWREESSLRAWSFRLPSLNTASSWRPSKENTSRSLRLQTGRKWQSFEVNSQSNSTHVKGLLFPRMAAL